MEGTIHHRSLPTSIQAFPITECLRRRAELPIHPSEAGSVPIADEIKASKNIGETLVLANLGKLVDCGDHYRRQIAVDIVINDVDRQCMLATRALSVCAD